MNRMLKIACGALALVLFCQATPVLLAQDQWEIDLYIKDVKEGKYKDDMKAVAVIVGISEQELFDKYVAKSFRVEAVLRVSLFAKELNQDMAALLKIATKYAWGNNKRWRKFYKDANVPDDVVERVTKQYNELAKTALKNTLQREAEEAARAAKVVAAPPNPMVPLVVQKVAQRTAMPFGCAKLIVDDLMQKKGISFEEAVEAAIFAAKTHHYERRLASQITADMKGKVLASLCQMYPPTPELKEEIVLVSNYIKDELKNKDAVPPVKELLKETPARRDTAEIIAQHTQVSAPKIVKLLREVEGEEDVARACAIARVTGKDVADIMQTKRTGGWYAVVITYDVIEKMEEIQETVFAIMTAYEKKMTPNNPTP